MKIVAHIDAADRIVDVHTAGHLRLFDNGSGDWRSAAEIPFTITPGATLRAIKALLAKTVEALGDCRTFVSGENRGLILSLLQEGFGFRVWKASGPIGALDLDAVAREDRALAAEREKEAGERAFVARFASPGGGGGCGGGGGLARRKRTPEAIEAAYSLTESLGEGRLRIDLADVLARYRNANSLDVLEPLLQARRFASLEILCDHLPRWFSARLAALDFKADVSARERGVSALVSPISREGAP